MRHQQFDRIQLCKAVLFIDFSPGRAIFYKDVFCREKETLGWLIHGPMHLRANNCHFLRGTNCSYTKVKD